VVPEYQDKGTVIFSPQRRQDAENSFAS